MQKYNYLHYFGTNGEKIILGIYDISDKEENSKRKYCDIMIDHKICSQLQIPMEIISDEKINLKKLEERVIERLENKMILIHLNPKPQNRTHP